MDFAKVPPKEGCTSQLAKRRVRINLEPMPRRGTGSKGKLISLLTNHFKVETSNLSGHFYCYNVQILHEDGYPVNKKAIKRRIIDGINGTYATELAGNHFAYDGNEKLYTVGSLPHKKMEFFMVLDNVSAKRVERNGNFVEGEDPERCSRKRLKHASKSRNFKIEISLSKKIPIHTIAYAQNWQESGNFDEALAVLNTILRHNAARKGCLLLGKLFFENEPRNFTNLGGGLFGCRRFYSSFQATQRGLSLNFGVSNTTIIQPGPVVDFVLANQNVRDCHQIDWNKAKRTLKNLKIKVVTSHLEHRITGLSEKSCKQQRFLLNKKDDNHATQITVYDYFIEHHNIVPEKSAELPCINVGNPKKATYYPLELCSLLPLQRYTKQLSPQQIRSMIEKSSLKPRQMIEAITDAMKSNKYNHDPLIHSCGITINKHFTRVEGRVLPAPRLRIGDGKELIPQNGRWSYSNKKLFKPAKIKHWAVVNFSSGFKISYLCEHLRKVGQMRGMAIDSPKVVLEENCEFKNAPPFVRVEKMYEQYTKFSSKEPDYFILCLLPQRMSKDLYGLWKRKTLEHGIFNQCLTNLKVCEQTLANVLLKINAKLGGLNSLLVIENIPIVSKVPTIIFGMSLSNNSPHRESVASVVASRQWPLVSCYKASARIQQPSSKLIDTLFMPVTEEKDNGIVRELLIDFYAASAKRKPEQIIIFRGGACESQFNQVLNTELGQFIEACRCLDQSWSPKVTMIASSRTNHTRFFLPNSPENVPPGIVVDNRVSHPHNYDFYICPHSAIKGTTRPVHYHVLLDEIGFPVDELQKLVHSLSYECQRAYTVISEVAPLRYARLVTAHMLELMAFSDTANASNYGCSTSSACSTLPKLHDNVRNSMFFC
ncbi:hypothetical protein L6164_034296 [Bauhinia variegata]|uniref:Uncharacterized protein n=1 Tax=Bauhinia variegata TaxID=167791 RepID=A0ACB9KV59_BAUVA|nr:hypothetical protein L6164_034296 [Bauhinia variegata]